MQLPRNAYTRYAARQSGKACQRWAEHSACLAGETRSVRGHYLCGTIDPHFWADRAVEFRTEAYYWRAAWWCPIRVGGFLESGRSTWEAFTSALGAYAPELILLPTGALLVAGLIWFGTYLGGR